MLPLGLLFPEIYLSVLCGSLLIMMAPWRAAPLAQNSTFIGWASPSLVLMCFYILVAAFSQINWPAWAVQVTLLINIFVRVLVTKLYSFPVVCPKSIFPLSVLFLAWMWKLCRMWKILNANIPWEFIWISIRPITLSILSSHFPPSLSKN